MHVMEKIGTQDGRRVKRTFFIRVSSFLYSCLVYRVLPSFLEYIIIFISNWSGSQRKGKDRERRVFESVWRGR